MANSKQVFRLLLEGISLNEPQEERECIAYLLMEKIFGMTKADILAAKKLGETDRQWAEGTSKNPKTTLLGKGLSEPLQQILDRVNHHEPIQYIVGEQEFYGRTFYVDPSVLIPRPETELLVDEVIKFCRSNKRHSWRLIDIGTGSGCIPITLSLEIPNLTATGTDISMDALGTATKNAGLYRAEVKFMKNDILLEDLSHSEVDLIVSNPPYITHSEKSSMKANVLEYEPPMALFVPDEDPLVFYKALIKRGIQLFKGQGWIFVECNEKFAGEVARLFQQHLFDSTKIIKDLSGKDRIVAAHYQV